MRHLFEFAKFEKTTLMWSLETKQSRKSFPPTFYQVSLKVCWYLSMVLHRENPSLREVPCPRTPPTDQLRLDLRPSDLEFCVLVIRPQHINPLTPKSDQHLISPYNITSESYIKVMRIKEMISD